MSCCSNIDLRIVLMVVNKMSQDLVRPLDLETKVWQKICFNRKCVEWIVLKIVAW